MLKFQKNPAPETHMQLIFRTSRNRTKTPKCPNPESWSVIAHLEFSAVKSIMTPNRDKIEDLYNPGILFF